jgi:hypothetical protein
VDHKPNQLENHKNDDSENYCEDDFQSTHGRRALGYDSEVA